MREEVGAMQFRVQGEQIKNDERRKRRRKNEYKEKKNMYEKTKIYEFIKNNKVNSPVL
jgi:hypothetical protein